MKDKLIALIYIYAFIFCLGCGSRKVQTDISKVNIEQSGKVEERNNVEEKESASSAEQSKELITEYTESSKITETKRYDAITGNLIEDSKVTEKGKAKKDSEKTASKTVTYNRTVTHNIYRNIDVHRTIDSKDKKKETDTNNKPLYWMLFGVGAIGVIVWGVVRYFKR